MHGDEYNFMLHVSFRTKYDYSFTAPPKCYFPYVRVSNIYFFVDIQMNYLQTFTTEHKSVFT